MPEETTQTGEEETTQTEQSQDGTTQTETESTSTETESAPTTEELAELRQYKSRYENQNDKIREQGEQLAASNEKTRQYEVYYANQAEKARQTTAANDPLGELRIAQFKAALDGDDAAFSAAGRQYEAAVEQRLEEKIQPMIQRAQHDVLAVIDTQNRAAEMGVSRDQLAKMATTLGVTQVTTQNAPLLAKLAAMENGTYDESQAKAKAAQDRETQLVSLLTSGAQGGARGPGMTAMTPEQLKQEYNPFKMVEYLDAPGENVRPGQEQAAKDYLATVDPEEVPERFKNI